MGWWSTDILGGDEPLDDIWEFEGLVGLGEDEAIYPVRDLAEKESLQGKIRDAFNKSPEAWLNISEEKLDNDSRSISAQVGAVIAMACGVDMPEKYKEKVVKYILEDDWMQECHDRELAVLKLVNAVREYKSGDIVIIKSQGLFEKMAETMKGEGA